VKELKDIEYENPILKELREEVKQNLRLSKSNRESDIPIQLHFYKYKVRKSDTFFKIMARTGMNIDTLSSVNYLSSPQDIYEGMVLLIPNMRGVFESEENEYSEQTKTILSQKYSIPEKNFIYDKKRKEYFISGKTLGKLEKSFFYGFSFIVPLKQGRMSSNFGARLDPFSKKSTFHGGIDIAAPKGTEVFASAEGEVIFCDEKGGYGNLIVIKHKLGYQTRYGHLSKFHVKEGDRVLKGQKIAEVGSTGRSTGNHLHFEVRRFSKIEKPIFNQHL
jgi:murein DD-endopeptidase MepM/ murein hydrolase activator NlpD